MLHGILPCSSSETASLVNIDTSSEIATSGRPNAANELLINSVVAAEVDEPL